MESTQEPTLPSIRKCDDLASQSSLVSDQLDPMSGLLPVPDILSNPSRVDVLILLFEKSNPNPSQEVNIESLLGEDPSPYKLWCNYHDLEAPPNVKDSLLIRSAILLIEKVAEHNKVPFSDIGNFLQDEPCNLITAFTNAFDCFQDVSTPPPPSLLHPDSDRDHSSLLPDLSSDAIISLDCPHHDPPHDVPIDPGPHNNPKPTWWEDPPFSPSHLDEGLDPTGKEQVTTGPDLVQCPPPQTGSTHQTKPPPEPGQVSTPSLSPDVGVTYYLKLKPPEVLQNIPFSMYMPDDIWRTLSPTHCKWHGVNQSLGENGTRVIPLHLWRGLSFRAQRWYSF